MDYNERQAKALENANKIQETSNTLQDKTNKLQQQMIDVIEKNNTETSNHNRAIRVLTIVIVVVGIVSGIISFWATRVVNKIAFDNLQKSYTPWLQVTSVKVSALDSNHVELVHGCKNYTNAPALELYIKYTILNGVSIESESPTYDSNPLMPNYEGTFNCIFTTQNWEQTVLLLEKIDSGEYSVRFEIHFKDVFGHNIVVHQETKRIDRKFRITSYKVDGINYLFEEI